MDFTTFPQTAFGVESAWRALNPFSNTGNVTGLIFDIPPNQYTFSVPREHGPTIPRLESLVSTSQNWGPNYYHTINQAAGNIYNFHNFQDAALQSWEINQLTKPDFADGPEWIYSFECDGAPCSQLIVCLLYTSPSPRDQRGSRMPSSA